MAREPRSSSAVAARVADWRGAMSHSIPSADRVAAPWPSAGRWLDRLGHVVGLALRRAVRCCGFGSGLPEMRVSRDWLEEHEQRARGRDDM